MAEEAIRQQSVGIIGAGAAGLITGYTLLHDGFQKVQLLTRDTSVGGVWAKQRTYPGVSINNVHGEFAFSPLPMPPPALKAEAGNRLCGEDMTAYMEKFADTYLAGKIRFETEILDVRRGREGLGWDVEVLNLRTGNKEVLSYARIVLCTGGCSQAHVPATLSVKSAEGAGFWGPVVHSSEFGSRVGQILREAQANPDYSVVVVGGGKSAQDISSHLARHGISATVVFDKTDAVIAAPVQLPDWIRKSRCLAVFSPHIELRTRLERFLHTTTLGSKITRAFWNFLTWSSLDVLKVPKDSPLRNAHSMFWGIRTNDEGTGRKDGFYALVEQGQIKLAAPNRAEGYASDGKSVMLRDGQTLRANAVILATGFSSSWTGIFTEKTIEELGIGRHPPLEHVDEWNHYKTLASPLAAHPQRDQWASSIYRGLVPAKNINKRDFAINGAVFTTNNGYGFEVMAHWISSGDRAKAAWMRKRFPGMLMWVNESYGGGLTFFSWPQAMDELLEDMGLPTMRSGGNWLTWPFKVTSVDEIATLGEERRAKREADEALA
ncbi:FAD/NAD(P)-binding domain-containing protein [Boletus reticuloceps]|uniref:FAD/NAD(P)-binding domain-containing protein n=1 Tax=Boletus reticuloceps TaxID=495285 RepID=A0A8I2Z3J2_9AGAM|nr:FAD/NAD(P)-binding domain-containing protein [Boletus reticuloceps]